jgi:uncharacterized coiled-coil protein SlyX
VIGAALVLGGCNESQTVKQLKLEKAQIVQEFNDTKAQMQTTIDEQAEKINALEAKISNQENVINGYQKFVFEIIPENEKLKKENEQLKQNLQNTASESKITGEEAQEKLEQLKALQEKAKTQE